jgi:hypothetical protein
MTNPLDDQKRGAQGPIGPFHSDSGEEAEFRMEWRLLGRVSELPVWCESERQCEREREINRIEEYRERKEREEMNLRED